MARPLSYARPGADPPRESRAWRYALIVAIALIAMLAIAMATPLFNKSRGGNPRLACASNLRQINLAAFMYASADVTTKRYPDTFGTLLEKTDLTSEAFLCRSTRDVRAPGPPEQLKRQLDSTTPPGTGGYCSFIYVGGGLTGNSPETSVVAYEPPTNHPGEGGNVVYLGGKVEWKQPAELQKIITALNAGKNPP